jgi:uncharacterized protein YegL
VTFDSAVTVLQDFVSVDQFVPPTLAAGGTTAMGGGVNRALDLVQARKATLKANGVAYYRPWVFLITDGEPAGEPAGEIERAIQRVQHEEAQKRVAFFAVGVEGANVATLSRLSARVPLQLAGLQFREMFVWLSQSMAAVAQSQLGAQVALPSWDGRPSDDGCTRRRRPARPRRGGRLAGARRLGAGDRHATRGQPCQDSCAFHITRDGVLVAAACDGAGSAPLSAAGADVAARTAVSSCVDALAATSGRDGARGEHWWTQRLRCAAGAARDAVRHEAARRDVEPCDLATTLLLVLATAERVVSLQIGDGAVVASGADDAVVGVTTPERGEYINETSFLTSAGAVEAARVGEWRGPVAHVALTTDGLQVVALDLASGCRTRRSSGRSSRTCAMPPTSTPPPGSWPRGSRAHASRPERTTTSRSSSRPASPVRVPAGGGVARDEPAAGAPTPHDGGGGRARPRRAARARAGRRWCTQSPRSRGWSPRSTSGRATSTPTSWR